MKTNKLHNVQLLRAIACTSVVFWHSIFVLEKGNIVDKNLNLSDKLFFLHFGVDLFFVISGFIMFHTTLYVKNNIHNGITFFKKRIIRIAPMYWAVTSVQVIGLILFPSAFGSKRFSFFDTTCSFLFLPYLDTNNILALPVLGAGQTLNYEMFFYLIFASLIAAAIQNKLLPSGVLFWVLVSFGLFISSNSAIIQFTTSPLLFEFFLGMIIAKLYNSEISFQGISLFALMLLALFLLIAGSYYESSLNRVIVYGLPSSILVFSLVFLEKNNMNFSNKLILHIGDSSYSIYLTHSMFIPVLVKCIRYFHLSDMINPIIAMATIPILALIFGQACYYFVERKMTLYLHKTLPVKYTF